MKKDIDYTYPFGYEELYSTYIKKERTKHMNLKQAVIEYSKGVLIPQPICYLYVIYKDGYLMKIPINHSDIHMKLITDEVDNLIYQAYGKHKVKKVEWGNYTTKDYLKFTSLYITLSNNLSNTIRDIINKHKGAINNEK